MQKTVSRKTASFPPRPEGRGFPEAFRMTCQQNCVTVGIGQCLLAGSFEKTPVSRSARFSSSCMKLYEGGEQSPHICDLIDFATFPSSNSNNQ